MSFTDFDNFQSNVAGVMLKHFDLHLQGQTFSGYAFAIKAEQ